ncbi:CDP-alcohol phosphatidyltransferase-domain-containing protein [Xylaria venustula]|nr:CDP-alcohol phosphatidyltransferase-domain-containing protein [Xylaria venustula]
MVVVMLMHRPCTATPPARSLLRRIHVVARQSGADLGTGLTSPLNLGFARVPRPPTPPHATVARTRLCIASPDAMVWRTNSMTGTWSLIRARSTSATTSCRYLSNTAAKHLAAERGDGRESAKTRRQQGGASQPQSKGIRKVLPSLTPHENIYTVPNMLTFSRLIAAPFIGYAILHDAHTLALGLFAYAGVSDLLDGWIARRWKLQTVVGSVVDPMADKLLMTVLTVCLAVQGSLPVWLATIILGRDVGLGISAIYYRWISLPPPKTFTRYWDFSLPSAEVRPTTISKYNTFLQLGLMGATMVAPVVAVDVSSAMTALQYIVATTTIWSGLSYVFSKDAVRILSEKKQEKKPNGS